MSIFDNFDDHYGGHELVANNHNGNIMDHHAGQDYRDFGDSHDFLDSVGNSYYDYNHLSNADTILNYDDPLAHAGQFQCNPLHFEHISTHANVFGGQDIYSNGIQVASTHSNIFGGQDIYSNGTQVASTHSNIFGGQDIYSNGTQVASTHSNIFGGQDIYSNGTQVASTHANVFGGQDTNVLKHK